MTFYWVFSEFLPGSVTSAIFLVAGTTVHALHSRKFYHLKFIILVDLKYLLSFYCIQLPSDIIASFINS